MFTCYSPLCSMCWPQGQGSKMWPLQPLCSTYVPLTPPLTTTQYVLTSGSRVKDVTSSTFALAIVRQNLVWTSSWQRSSFCFVTTETQGKQLRFELSCNKVVSRLKVKLQSISHARSPTCLLNLNTKYQWLWMQKYKLGFYKSTIFLNGTVWFGC